MKKLQNEAIVGMFVILGFIMLTLIVFFISGAFLFRSGYTLDVMYEYVNILDKGAPVRMAGVRVGEVSQVDLIHDEKAGKTRVRIKLFIAKEVEIRENYSFSIRGTHILSEPHIEITPVPGNAPVISPNALIEGVNPVPVEDLIERINTIGGDIDGILSSFRESGGEANLNESLRGLKESTDSINRVLKKINEGEGTVGRLLSSDELYQDMRAFMAEIKAKPWRLLKRDDGRRKVLGVF